MITITPDELIYENGTSVTLNIEEKEGYVFYHWGGDVYETDKEIQIKMDSDKNIIAYFSMLPGYYNLITNVDPIGASFFTLTPGGGTYESGTIVTVNLIVNEDFTFDHWEGDISGNDFPVQIKMDSNKTINAFFTHFITYLNKDYFLKTIFFLKICNCF